MHCPYCGNLCPPEGYFCPKCQGQVREIPDRFPLPSDWLHFVWTKRQELKEKVDRSGKPCSEAVQGVLLQLVADLETKTSSLDDAAAMCVALLDYVGEPEEAELEDFLLSGITLNDEFRDITEEEFIAAIREYYTPKREKLDGETEDEAQEGADVISLSNLFKTDERT